MITAPDNVVPIRQTKEDQKVDPVFLAMSIAQMHVEGKLKPTTEPEPDSGNR